MKKVPTSAVAGQREATRQRSLEQYFKVNTDAGNAMGRLQALRQQLVGTSSVLPAAT